MIIIMRKSNHKSTSQPHLEAYLGLQACTFRPCPVLALNIGILQHGEAGQKLANEVSFVIPGRGWDAGKVIMTFTCVRHC